MPPPSRAGQPPRNAGPQMWQEPPRYEPPRTIIAEVLDGGPAPTPPTGRRATPFPERPAHPSATPAGDSVPLRGVADAETVTLPAVAPEGVARSRYDYYAEHADEGDASDFAHPDDYYDDVPPADIPDGARGGGSAPRRGPGVLGVIGELVLTLGVVVLLFVVYEVYWTDLISAGKQQQASSTLEKQWQQGDDPLTNGRTNHFNLNGQGFAKLFVPKFGPDFAFTVLQGTDDQTLESGPGHYTDSAMPGQPGNFAVAGHRVGKGSPFNDLGLLNSCDNIVVETAKNWFVYRVLPMKEETSGWAQGRGSTDAQCQGVQPLAAPYNKTVGREIVLPSDGDVILPVPNRPDLTGLPPKPQKLITLTTCHPQFSDKQRMILHGVLVTTYPNDPAHPTAPPELTQPQQG